MDQLCDIAEQCKNKEIWGKRLRTEFLESADLPRYLGLVLSMHIDVPCVQGGVCYMSHAEHGTFEKRPKFCLQWIFRLEGSFMIYRRLGSTDASR